MRDSTSAWPELPARVAQALLSALEYREHKDGRTLVPRRATHSGHYERKYPRATGVRNKDEAAHH